MLSKFGKKVLSVGSLSLLAVSLTATANVAFAAEPLKASTSMTVVTVDRWVNEATKSPSESLYYDVTMDVYNVKYTSHSLCWKWNGSQWKSGSTAINARIWKFFTENGWRTFVGQSWDYLKPHDTCKERHGSVPQAYLGFMLSSLCDTNKVCVARERSNIDFQNPSNPDF